MKSARRTTRCSGWDRIYDLMRIYSPAADLERYTDWARAFMIVNHESARRSEVQMLWYDYRLQSVQQGMTGTANTKGLENRLSDFYKEHYFNELKRREELAGRITLPLGVLSILVGSIVAAFREISRPNTTIEYLIVILLISAAIPACMVIVNLWQSYHNHRYWVIDTPAQIMSYKNSLLNYYEDPGVQAGAVSKEQALLDVLAYIDQEYAKHADYNSRVSDRRSYFLSQANVYLAITLVVTSLALVLQLTRLASLPEQLQTVKIVNIRDFSMTTPTGKAGTPANGSGSVSNNNPPKPPIPQKPQPTGGRLIRGDVDPGQVR